MITWRVVIISGVLALLIGLLSNVVANLIHVPAGWEWALVVLLLVTFIISLYVQIRYAGTRPEQGQAQTEGSGAEKADAGMKVEVARKARMKNVKWFGDVGNVIIKGTKTSPEDNGADKH